MKLETCGGVVGYGENTPLGPNYLPAYADGTRRFSFSIFALFYFLKVVMLL